MLGIGQARQNIELISRLIAKSDQWVGFERVYAFVSDLTEVIKASVPDLETRRAIDSRHARRVRRQRHYPAQGGNRTKPLTHDKAFQELWEAIYGYRFDSWAEERRSQDERGMRAAIDWGIRASVLAALATWHIEP